MNPAPAFATTYFFNFVKPVCAAIESGAPTSVADRPWQPSAGESLRLNIVVPADLALPAGRQIAALTARLRWQELRFSLEDRSRIVFLVPGSAKLVDLPTVVDTIRYTLPADLEASEQASAIAAEIAEFRQELVRLVEADVECSRHAVVHEFAWLDTLDAS